MPHPLFDHSAESPAPISWWQVLRDLGIALVVVAAAGLIGGFLVLSPVHAQERAAPVRLSAGPAGVAAVLATFFQFEQGETE